MSSQKIKSITFFLRDPRQGNFSIEQIFQEIAEAAKMSYKVNLFFVDSSNGRFSNILKARKVQGDINHITGDVNWLIYGLEGRKTIITIHDLGHFESTLKGWKRLVFKKLWLEWPLKKAKKITAISNFTKNRLLHHFPHVRDKIEVIYNPISPAFKNSKPGHKINKLCPKILQIGQLKNKNVENLIEAVADMECELLLLRRIDYDTKKLLEELNVKYKFYSDLKQADVARLYRNADILYFASTYEGFGMPIIEAQSQGCAVLTSNLASMPEIAGLGACLVDPYSVSSIKDGLVSIINDDSYRLELIYNGYSNISRFAMNNILQKYLNLYQEIINEK